MGYSIGSRAMRAAVVEPIDLEGMDKLRRLTEAAVPVTAGEEGAPVTVIVFGDYLCIHCAEFSLRHRPLLEASYVATGKARLVFYDFPMAPAQGTFLAARAARCAGDQGQFWTYHDLLYRNQRDFAEERDKIHLLEVLADGLGLDSRGFRGCLNSDRHAQAVSANRELAHALGLPGTPVILVGSGNGMSRRLDSYTFEAIKAAVDSILEAPPDVAGCVTPDSLSTGGVEDVSYGYVSPREESQGAATLASGVFTTSSYPMR